MNLQLKIWVVFNALVTQNSIFLCVNFKSTHPYYKESVYKVWIFFESFLDSVKLGILFKMKSACFTLIIVCQSVKSVYGHLH